MAKYRTMGIQMDDTLKIIVLEILGEGVTIIRIIIIIRIRHWYYLCLFFVQFKLEPSYDLNIIFKGIIQCSRKCNKINAYIIVLRQYPNKYVLNAQEKRVVDLAQWLEPCATMLPYNR